MNRLSVDFGNILRGVMENAPLGRLAEGGLHVDALISDVDEMCKLLNKSKSSATLTKSTLSKSTEKSNEYRDQGIANLKNGFHQEALLSYTKSVATAPNNSADLALAYGYRSEILFNVGQYVPCLLDINRALGGECSRKLQKKLIDRKKQCLARIKSASKVRSTDNRIEGNETDPVKVTDVEEENEWNDMCNFKNTLLPTASSKIKLECNGKWGRFTIATKDIEPGEILSIQPFSSLTLEPGLNYNNCSHCLLKCHALIPCPSCSERMYCSEACRLEAYNSYHRVECKLLSFEETRNLHHNQFIAVRMLLKWTEQGAELKTVMEKLSKEKIFEERTDPTMQPFVNDYLSVLRLCRTFSPLIVNGAKKLAVEAVLALQRVNFFENESDLPNESEQDLNEKMLFSALLLLNHLVSVRTNIFSIKQAALPDISKKTRLVESRIGVGTCPLHNLINHSCYPNVCFFVRNGEHVLFSLRPIKKNEQLFTTYFSTFDRRHIAERIKQFSEFGFVCQCEACANNWPLYENLQARPTQFKVENFDGAIARLIETIMLPVKDGLVRQSNRQVFRIICDYVKWLHTNVKMPSAAILECENILLNFTVSTYADFLREPVKDQVELVLKGTTNFLCVSAFNRW